MNVALGRVYQSTPGEPNATLRLSQLIKLIRRHLWLIVPCAVAGGIGALVYGYSLPKVYTASSMITVEGDKFAIPELQGALGAANAPDPMPWVRTEVQALTSRSLLQATAAKLGLENNPEFNTALRPPGALEQLKSQIQSFLPRRADTGVSQTPEDIVLGTVDRALTVFQDNRSLVISTAFTAQDPTLAANFINTLISEYIKSRAQQRVDANQGAHDALVQRINEVKGQLDAVERRMRDLRNASEQVGLRAGSVGQQQVEDLATAASRASVERAQAEANWDRASSLAKAGMSSALASVLDSPTISRLRDQESSATRRVAELATRYGPNYPGVHNAEADAEAVRRQIAGEVQRIMASLEAQVQVARQQEAQVQRQLAAARVTGVKAQNAQAELDQLDQEAKTRRSLYQTLLEHEQQTVSQPGVGGVPDVRVLSVAVPPGAPSGPNVKLIAGLGGLSGALVGCLVALLRVRSIAGFETAADLTHATGLSVLGTVPRKMARNAREPLAERVVSAPGGQEADALRQLRAQLRLSGRNSEPRIVAVTSVGNVDATGFAAALARAAALHGERVLLIEGNLVSPSIGQRLGERSDGLLKVLATGEEWPDALVVDRESPLDLLLAGRPAIDSHAAVSGMPFQNLLVETRREYDLVLLDAPSADSMDTAALAMRVDTAILLVDCKADPATMKPILSRLQGTTHASLAAVLFA